MFYCVLYLNTLLFFGVMTANCLATCGSYPVGLCDSSSPNSIAVGTVGSLKAVHCGKYENTQPFGCNGSWFVLIDGFIFVYGIFF